MDYYNARYYDPVAGVFLSVDAVQGNPQGMNPYAYVASNPETNNDPTGQRLINVGTQGDGGGNGSGSPQPVLPPAPKPPTAGGSNPSKTTSPIVKITHTSYNFSAPRGHLNRTCASNPSCASAYRKYATLQMKEFAMQALAYATIALDIALALKEGDPELAIEEEQKITEDLAVEEQAITAEEQLLQEGAACSFTPQTLVSTSDGKKPIVSLKREVEI